MPASRSCRSWGMVSSEVDQDHAVGVVAGQRAGPADAGRALPCRTGGDRDRRLVAGAPLLDAAQDLHRPRAVQAVEDQVDQAGPAAAARARALVLGLVQQPLDPGAGARRHVRAAVDHLGHRGQRDPRLGGDGGQRGPPRPARSRAGPDLIGSLVGTFPTSPPAGQPPRRSQFSSGIPKLFEQYRYLNVRSTGRSILPRPPFCSAIPAGYERTADLTTPCRVARKQVGNKGLTSTCRVSTMTAL